nr:MAG TPA: hypothetical protein [Caudoviricetes sp.]
MGKVIMSGIVPLLSVPVRSVEISALATGSIVKTNVDGVLTEFVVVNHGVPGNSSLYGDGCDGTWLLMKNIYNTQKYHTSAMSTFNSSTLCTWLNDEFLNLFTSEVQSAISTVNIPYGYYNSSTAFSGDYGLICKIFLLSCYELGLTKNDINIPEDGVKLSYFTTGETASANAKRVAQYNNAAYEYWTRTPYRSTKGYPVYISTTGGSASQDKATYTKGVRPAFVLPSSTQINSNTMEIMA